MGGLLDKANAAKEPETEAAELVKATKAATKPSPAPAASPPAAGSPDTATKVNLAGWVIILIGAILSLQGGAWG
ncbi:MAG: hypothetical protein VXZ34_05100, partial [Candidatus Thermoplasmatota archaeon]|nr:hypothetical protein [Candidatus Thermoplasmatota archaeon]